MIHSIQVITAKYPQLTKPMHPKVFDFIVFMHAKAARQSLPSKTEPDLLSERALAMGWNLPEEDYA